MSFYLFIRSGVNFINMLTKIPKAQKDSQVISRKKVDQLVELLYFSGFAIYAVRSSLMKLPNQNVCHEMFSFFFKCETFFPVPRKFNLRRFDNYVFYNCAKARTGEQIQEKLGNDFLSDIQ